MKILKWLPLLAALIFAASCSNVTETGNPCPSESCPLVSPSVNIAGYTNETYGVTVLPPEGWTFNEDGDNSVVFESQPPEVSTARMTFERLDPKPDSLFAYLSDTYPDYTFKYYSTLNLTGYLYDNPQTGENGGDLREYFFLYGDVLVHVEAEVFASGLIDLGLLFNGDPFQ